MVWSLTGPKSRSSPFLTVDTHGTRILGRRRRISSRKSTGEGCTPGTRWFPPSTNFVLSAFLIFFLVFLTEVRRSYTLLSPLQPHAHCVCPGRAVQHDTITLPMPAIRVQSMSTVPRTWATPMLHALLYLLQFYTSGNPKLNYREQK